jgi:Protein of unknown function (DUF998)
VRIIEKLRSTEFLLGCGVVGPLLFILVFLLEGATRPDYSVWRNYVSDLALSDQGWEQITNFLLCGTLCIGFAVGLRRIWRTGTASVWGPRLIGVFGLGLVVAGMFVTDPGRGYPAGAPLKGDPQTLHGWVHGINALVVFPVLIVACFVLARRFAVEPGNRGWATCSRLTGALILLLAVVGTISGALDENGVLPSPTGLFQRAEITLGWTWLALTALRLLRQERKAILDGASARVAIADAVVGERADWG